MWHIVSLLRRPSQPKRIHVIELFFTILMVHKQTAERIRCAALFPKQSFILWFKLNYLRNKWIEDDDFFNQHPYAFFSPRFLTSYSRLRSVFLCCCGGGVHITCLQSIPNYISHTGNTLLKAKFLQIRFSHLLNILIRRKASIYHKYSARIYMFREQKK